MCGLVGWISADRMVDSKILSAMRNMIIHRGPDGEGQWVDDRRVVGLGHQRLAIVDLTGQANQPMTDSRHRAVIVFNGEIYNHQALRKELLEQGANFLTDHSDTEVILNGYLAWGLVRLLNRLVGMFAFAIYDIHSDKVVVVRDHLGIKPLYFVHREKELIFASEVKALLAHPQVEATLNHENYYHYLSFRSLPAPRTLFKNIQKLGPGEYLEFDVIEQRFDVRPYWNPLQGRNTADLSRDDSVEALSELLDQSMELQLLADVPVGVFLSGGVDSAFLLTLAAERSRGINTYTAGYPGHLKYDESDMARNLARNGGAHHHEGAIDSDTFSDALPAVAYYQDEPIAAPVCVPVYLLAREARRTGVPVVLAGEGSDEIFIGYKNWLRLRDLQKWNNKVPDLPGRMLRKCFAAVAAKLMAPMSPYPEILRRASADQPLFWSGGMDFSERGKRKLIGPAVDADDVNTYESLIEPLYVKYLQSRSRFDITGWMSFVDLKFRLPELMLPRLDKMGMAYSIEGRVPFLDHRVVEFVMGLDRNFRAATGRTGKPLFKSVAGKKLPRDFVYQRKRGFQAPVKEWKNTAFGHRYMPALLAFARRSGLYNVQVLEELLRRSGDRLYFSLTNFMLWYLIFIENILPEYFPELGQRPWLTDVDRPPYRAGIS